LHIQAAPSKTKRKASGTKSKDKSTSKSKDKSTSKSKRPREEDDNTEHQPKRAKTSDRLTAFPQPPPDPDEYVDSDQSCGGGRRRRGRKVWTRPVRRLNVIETVMTNLRAHVGAIEEEVGHYRNANTTVSPPLCLKV
jgi:hypothetical protein